MKPCPFTLFFFSLILACASRHTNNWAVLVDTSRFWFNYRHVGNTLAMYRSIKRLGIPDSRIILMLADDAACSTRNPYPGVIRNQIYYPTNLYGESIEVDYRSYEVTVANFIRVLTGRLPSATPSSKRLDTDHNSNIFIYMTGHGGDGFLKFQDEEEISSREMADAIEQMWQKRRYNEIFFIVDTCQAESMGKLIYSPNVVTLGSSSIGEDSFSHDLSSEIGVFVSDRFSFHAHRFLERITPESMTKLSDFLRLCPYELCHSTVVWRTDLLQRSIDHVLLTDFVASVRQIEAGPTPLQLNSTTQDTVANTVTVPEPKANVENLQYSEPFCIDF